MWAFASDYDGTLYHWDRRAILEEDLSAIAAFQRNGHQFGICTGRSCQGVLLTTPPELQFDFYILVNGAILMDRSRTVRYVEQIARGSAKEIYERFAAKFPAIVLAGDTVYNFGKEYPLQVCVERWDEIPDPVCGVSCYTGSPERARQIAGDINAEFGSEVHAYANVSNVDVCPIHASKGKAALLAKEMLGAASIGGLGDSYNDIPLLEHVDRAYTFHRSPEAVQQAADCLVDSVGEALHDIVTV